MTDLQCRAQILVARHGEADYETELLTDDGGSLTDLGRKQSADLAESLAGERIAHVYVSSKSRAVQTGEIAAARLGVGVTVREALQEVSVGAYAGQSSREGDPDPFAPTFASWGAGDPSARIAGGESGSEVIDRLGGVLTQIADAHRGETVLVISHGGVMCTALSALARNLTPAFPVGRSLPNCAVVRLDVDDDGWVARSWAGEDVPT